MKLSLGGVATLIVALGLIAAAAAVACLYPERPLEGAAQARALAAERAFLQAKYPTATVSGPFSYKERLAESLMAGCVRGSTGGVGGRVLLSVPDYMSEHAYVVETDQIGLTVLVCRDFTSPSGFKAIEKWPKH